ncbi:uncharacterized protein LOC114355991 isoform X3 [Ostrinia furnacalis]|nr:uncharacterized protein LOC114355991 isoform X3 [Ostrinia furnacalis]
MSTSEPLFKKCFCIPLKTGCFILSYLILAFSSLQVLGLLVVTTYVGVATHGFDHFDRPYDTIEVKSVNQYGLQLIAILCFNVAWLAINIACLVGLHKKRPGPVRVYVAFATARLLLSFAGFFSSMMTISTTKAIIIHSIDIAVTICFIPVYCVYAAQLQRDQEEAPKVPPSAPVSDNNISFIIPPLVDKKTLVV